jgi:hypothetical protein
MLLLIINISLSFGDTMLSGIYIPRVSPCEGKASTVEIFFSANKCALARLR